MNMQEIREKARKLGLKPGKIKKLDLIQTIQKTEGNQACFQTGRESCEQTECCWRQDCLPN